jgi:hypothetical protein
VRSLAYRWLHKIGKSGYTCANKEGSLMAKTRSILWLVAGTLAGGGACGGGSNAGDVVSCTMASASIFGSMTICQEVPASDRAQLQKACVLPADAGLGTAGTSAHFTDGPCSHTNALGGCKVSNGSFPVTTWYYQSNGVGGATATPADIQTMCAGVGTFVAP